MKLNRKIKKLLTITAWLLVGTGMTTLLIAANNKPEVHSCRQVVVSIQGEGGKFYIDKNDVYGQIKYAAGGGVVGKPIAEVDLSMLEGMLEGQTWIRDAELYFDSKNVLHVLVAERDPIARVFTTAGNSFYIDSAGKRMPLLPGVSARLPVITGFPAAKKLYKSDSALLRAVTGIAQYINHDNFWQAQIAQIDMTPAGTFELMPVVGNHIVRIGTAEELDEKMNRLYLFYKQVLSKTGFDKYGIVDVQYNGQVIGVKSKTTSAVDSIQLQKNIQELVEKMGLQAAADSLAVEQAKTARRVADSMAKVSAAMPVKETEKQNNSIARTTEAKTKSNVVEKTKKAPQPKRPQPKAVMPNRKTA